MLLYFNTLSGKTLYLFTKFANFFAAGGRPRGRGGDVRGYLRAWKKREKSTRSGAFFVYLRFLPKAEQPPQREQSQPQPQEVLPRFLLRTITIIASATAAAIAPMIRKSHPFTAISPTSRSGGRSRRRPTRSRTATPQRPPPTFCPVPCGSRRSTRRRAYTGARTRAATRRKPP